AARRMSSLRDVRRSAAQKAAQPTDRSDARLWAGVIEATGLLAGPSALQPDHQAEHQEAGQPHPLFGAAISGSPYPQSFLVEFQPRIRGRTAERYAVDQHPTTLFVGHQAEFLEPFLATITAWHGQQQGEFARIA